MFKKLSSFAIAVALALALPSLASAAQLTNSGGGAVEIGSVIEGSSSGKTVIQIEGGPKTECESIKFADKLQVNSGGVVSGIGLGETASGICVKQAFKLEFLTFELKSATSGRAKVRAEVKLVGGGSCTWEGTVAVTYAAGSSEIQISGSKLGGLPNACGKATITGGYVLAVKTLPVVLD